MSNSLVSEMELTSKIRNHPKVSYIYFNLRGYFIYEDDNDIPIIEITKTYDGGWELYDVYMDNPLWFNDLAKAKLAALDLLDE